MILRQWQGRRGVGTGGRALVLNYFTYLLGRFVQNTVAALTEIAGHPRGSQWTVSPRKFFISGKSNLRVAT